MHSSLTSLGRSLLTLVSRGTDLASRRIAHGRYERSDLFGSDNAGRDIADVATVNPSAQKHLHYDSATLLGDHAKV
jgi:hypothetical protein